MNYEPYLGSDLVELTVLVANLLAHVGGHILQVAQHAPNHLHQKGVTEYTTTYTIKEILVKETSVVDPDPHESGTFAWIRNY